MSNSGKVRFPLLKYGPIVIYFEQVNTRFSEFYSFLVSFFFQRTKQEHFVFLTQDHFMDRLHFIHFQVSVSRTVFFFLYNKSIPSLLALHLCTELADLVLSFVCTRKQISTLAEIHHFEKVVQVEKHETEDQVINRESETTQQACQQDHLVILFEKKSWKNVTNASLQNLMNRVKEYEVAPSFSVQKIETECTLESFATDEMAILQIQNEPVRPP